IGFEYPELVFLHIRTTATAFVLLFFPLAGPTSQALATWSKYTFVSFAWSGGATTGLKSHSFMITNIEMKRMRMPLWQTTSTALLSAQLTLWICK
ncbi:hypothetical protein PMAYCL1PPCAC_21370, partial [Pristionchus mayeri]